MALGLIASGAPYAAAHGDHGEESGAFTQTNLVSDIPGLATILDPALQNPWGIAFGPNTPLWVDNQFNPTGGPSKITLYKGATSATDLVVKVPLEVAASSPTGIVFNPTSSFLIDQGSGPTPARFLFNETDFSTGAPEGRITGWSNVPTPPLTTTPTAARKQPGFPLGLAMVPDKRHGPRLLVADGVEGSVDVYDAAFAKVSTPGLFVDPDAAAEGLAPYNVAYLKGRVYVAYSRGPGGSGGAVSVFKRDGRFKKRLVTDGALNGPWGMVIAPEDWGRFGGRLLVGNVDDGTINAYGARSGRFRGTLSDASGKPLVNLGLWGLSFGNNTIGTPRTLIFAAGIGDEVSEHVYEHGLVGIIEPVGDEEDAG